MNTTRANAAFSGVRAWCGGLLAWLSAWPHMRWTSAKGRWVQTVLTAALVLAGVGSWALALVQPWAGHGEYGVVSVAAGLDVEKIRAAAADVDKLCAVTASAPRAVRRNPFALRTGVEAVVPVIHVAKPAAPEKKVVGQAPAANSALEILEKVKGLRLEVTLVTPMGERWAVINGENVREGDVIAGLEITEIQDGKVKLQQAGTTCLLRME